MKKILFPLFAISFLISSCSDDPVSEQIIGTWELQSVERTLCENPIDNIALVCVDDENCVNIQQELVCNLLFSFREDQSAVQTLTSNGDERTWDLKYTTNDDNDTVVMCDSPDDCETVRVECDTFSLTVTDDGCITNLVFHKV